ncbi:hypothetical protein KY321_05400, partial [Candidatus Woesearchaeota archaeon]|nr:hypothetical protein [Candidatus Woesearchaeota archaeon]
MKTKLKEFTLGYDGLDLKLEFNTNFNSKFLRIGGFTGNYGNISKKIQKITKQIDRAAKELNVSSVYYEVPVRMSDWYNNLEKAKHLNLLRIEDQAKVMTLVKYLRDYVQNLPSLRDSEKLMYMDEIKAEDFSKGSNVTFEGLIIQNLWPDIVKFVSRDKIPYLNNPRQTEMTLFLQNGYQ